LNNGHFATFNVAAVLIIISSLFSSQDEKLKPKQAR